MEHSVQKSPRRPDRRILVAVFVVVTVPLLLLLDSAIAFARGWETRSRLDITFLALMALAPCVVLTALSNAKYRKWLRDRAPDFLLLFITCCGTWLAGEVAVGRSTHKAPTVFHVRAPGLQQVFHPRPDVLPGVTSPSHFTTNSIGVRGREFPSRDSAYRILCIGGSTTECVYLDDSKTWMHLLMQRLQQAERPVWVGSIGISGYSTTHHLKFVEQSTLMPIQRSDLMGKIDCLVLLVGVNDLLRQLGMDCLDRGDRWDESNARDNQIMPLWRRSAVLELARRIYHTNRHDKIAVEDREGSIYAERRRLRQQAPACDKLPDLQHPLEEYRGRLRRIVEACEVKGVRPVFLTQPTLWDGGLSSAAESLLALGWLPSGEYVTAARLRKGLDQYNEALRNVCAELNVECVELESMNGQVEFFFDDAHFTDAGAEQVAHLVAQWFLQHSMH
jgi:lysophospholipase L1-like esterase